MILNKLKQEPNQQVSSEFTVNFLKTLALMFSSGGILPTNKTPALQTGVAVFITFGGLRSVLLHNHASFFLRAINTMYLQLREKKRHTSSCMSWELNGSRNQIYVVYSTEKSK